MRVSEPGCLTNQTLTRATWILNSMLLLVVSTSSAAATDTVAFNRDIRPLLSDNCFKCHGPDEETREANLRLDLRSGALARTDSGEPAIVPGQPDGSELLRRITADDVDLRMPPADSGKQLTAAQIELIRQWIKQGADWNEHWSFVPPVAVPPPVIQDDSWVQNDIDRFVGRRLEQEGLAQSPEADRGRLLRRVTFDLTGLPPGRDELNAFLADKSPDAYDKVVDRLLHSSHYGERMALEWLDVARYADTHGYQFDGQRFMWRWRDYVINAFNNNMPFDQFTIEQLAGDLLPDATLDQQIASGFNRNHIINGELGSVDEEFRVEYVADRVSTTSTAWMGLTMQCARCHDHKYDPVSQREYYQLFAFFDKIGDRGMDGMFSNAAPNIKAPTSDQERRLSDLNRRLKQVNAAMNRLQPDLKIAQDAWESAVREPFEDTKNGLVSYWSMDGHVKDIGGHHGEKDPMFANGVMGKSAVFMGLNSIKISDPAPLPADRPFTLSGWINFSKIHGERSVMTHMPEGTAPGRGYSFQIHNGRVKLALVHDYPGDVMEVETATRIQSGHWTHVLATYDGSGRAAGTALYIDGHRQPVSILHDSLSGPIDNSEVLEMGDGAPNARAWGQMDELRIYKRILTDDEIADLPVLSLESMLAVDSAKRTPEQHARIRKAFIDQSGNAEWQRAWKSQRELTEAKARLDGAIPTVMVMREMDKPGQTQILMRGAYDRPGDSVSAATPGFLPPLPDEFPSNRLGLARWLVSSDHPLTARVTVNRYWQMYFGTGLVNTPEDFGSQGTPPTHPQLLDWLAVRFMESGWDLRELQRLIVTSATYRQQSNMTPQSAERDRHNRLLARGPRFRLNAEFIRDQVLAVSGLMVHSIGGESVKPYQPDGLWKDGALDPTGNRWTAQVYHQDSGDKLYRRSMYTYWKRNAPPPTMQLFDAPERERCVVRRDRTNTPLQALALMNDPTFVEAARHLAERMLNEGGNNPEERIRFAFQLLACRDLTDRELAPLLQLRQSQHQRFTKDMSSAKALLSVGESPVNESLDAAELASYATVANVLFNLDESVTRN